MRSPEEDNSIDLVQEFLKTFVFISVCTPLFLPGNLCFAFIRVHTLIALQMGLHSSVQPTNIGHSLPSSLAFPLLFNLRTKLECVGDDESVG